VAGILIILREPLPDLGRGGSDYGVEVRVVLKVASEDFDAQSTFLQLSPTSFQRPFHQIPQHGWIAAAVFEQRICQDSIELGENRDSIQFTFR
jgi:hypothetical protein